MTLAGASDCRERSASIELEILREKRQHGQSRFQSAPPLDCRSAETDHPTGRIEQDSRQSDAQLGIDP